MTDKKDDNSLIKQQKQFIAHTENNIGKIQTLKDHLLNCAKLAKSFAIPEFENFFFLTGLFHDFGKYQKQFQLRLYDETINAPHSWVGASFINGLLKKTLNPIGIAINHHHSPISNHSHWQNNLTNWQQNKYRLILKECFENYIRDNVINKKTLEGLIPSNDKLNNDITEFLTRFILSAVCDADRLDTEKHGDCLKYQNRTVPDFDSNYLNNKLNIKFKSFEQKNEIDTLRTSAKINSERLAKKKSGFFSMELPTGMGKTLASVNWAVKHASFNKQKRIIIVLPFTSIIDQTAAELSSMFGNEYVLEHHSSLKAESGNFKGIEESVFKEKKKLGEDNWDYPIIVTTTVQFFETLFSNKPSKLRKLHNIINSVVIFDEIQSLPKPVLMPTLKMLEQVQKHCNTSFLFCTATMPAFEKRKNFPGIGRITPLIENKEEITQKTRRVYYSFLENLDTVSMDTLLEDVSECNDSCLIVCNTKKTASVVFEYLPKKWEKHYFLTTNLCPMHRRQIIKEIKNDLAKKQNVMVVSTQLIEAGVDLDFPRLYRETAPLEGIIQSAGRCNRNGLLENKGKVTIFKLEDSNFPDHQYKVASGWLESCVGANPDKLYANDFFTQYDASFIDFFVDMDKNKIQKEREKFNFKTVADNYKIIDQKAKSVFVWSYDETSKALYYELIDKLEKFDYLTRSDYKKMQPYMVTLFDKPFQDAFKEGLIKEYEDSFYAWMGGYGDLGLEKDGRPDDNNDLIV